MIARAELPDEAELADGPPRHVRSLLAILQRAVLGSSKKDRVRLKKELNMKQIEVPAGPEWETILHELKTEEVVLTRQGLPVALLTEFDEDEAYWQACENDPEFIASIARAREQVARGQTVSHEELKRELGID
jgi:hypothetical protein